MKWIDRVREVYGRLGKRAAGGPEDSPDAQALDSMPPGRGQPASVPARPATSLPFVGLWVISPAEARAVELESEYFRQMTIENTPYNDEYGMDGFPAVGDPAPSDLVEQALVRHLLEHPELREIPWWATYYPSPRPLAEIQAVLARIPSELISEETAAAVGVSREEFQDWAEADYAERYRAEQEQAISEAASRMIVVEGQVVAAASDHTGIDKTHQSLEEGAGEGTARAAHVAAAAFQPTRNALHASGRATPDGAEPSLPVNTPAATPHQTRQIGPGRS